MHVDRIDPAFGHWLAGFVDGEGCFYIGRICNRKKGVEYVNYRCAFTISLRDDDHAVLHEIRDTLGTGRIVTRKARETSTFRGSGPMLALELGSKAEAQYLVESSTGSRCARRKPATSRSGDSPLPNGARKGEASVATTGRAWHSFTKT